jgi:hypothetical protein
MTTLYIDKLLSQKAKWVYWQQVDKCRNKNNNAFKNYGGKGVRVTYNLKDFTLWYLKEIKKFTGEKPDVGRIDHSKSYSFCNIILQEHSDNVKERNNRLGNPQIIRQVTELDKQSNEIIKIYNSVKDAALSRKVTSSRMVHYCRKIIFPRGKTYFKYTKLLERDKKWLH